MTQAQINYHSLQEQKRHNQAQEALSKYQSDLQFDSSRYQTDTQAETSRYTSNTSAEANRYAADSKAAGQRYSADQSAAASRYSTDINKATQTAKLALDRQAMLFSNEIDRKRLTLDQLRMSKQNQYTQAQIDGIYNDIDVSLKKLANDSKALGLKEEAAKYENALTKWKKYETVARTAHEWVKTVDDTSKAISDIKDLIAALRKEAKANENRREKERNDELFQRVYRYATRNK